VTRATAEAPTAFPRVAIVVVGSSLMSGGGAERRFLRLWRHFNARGKPLVLVTNKALFESATRAGLLTVADVGERLRVVPNAAMLRSNLAIHHELRRVQPDVVHLPLAQRALVPLLVSLALPRPVVTHSMTATYFAQKSAVPLGTLILSRLLWRIARRIDSLYQGFVPTCADPLGFADKVRVAPCSFTDLDKFDRRSSDSGDGTIVFSGRLYPEKNPELFIHALKILQKRKPELSWRAVIAGDGPLGGRVRELVAAGDLSDRVTLGVYADMAPLLRTSSIFVSLQRTENYPSQALLEAMAAGNAVVATDVGETRRLVRPGETGLVVRPDVAALAEALADLTSRPQEARRLGENAAQLVRSEHTIERFAPYIESFWREATAEGL
jgi:glycosyltransferase involved in cell wall biosynthesis